MKQIFLIIRRHNKLKDFKKIFANYTDIVSKQFKYSLRIIFANKFIYFLTAAVLFFLLVVIINFFSSSTSDIKDTYYILLFPGILLIFYPTTFGIQNDEDSGMLENLFAIPNYRYKVWLPRLLMIYILVFLLLFALILISSVVLIVVPVFEMVFQLMFPIFFLGSLAFALSTVVRNGNGTAVIMVIIGLIFWISSGILYNTEWNIFLNPFDLPNDMSEAIWSSVIYSNRLYLLAGTILSILFGLFYLQKREKFV
ncbi:MAG: hypothetical protein K9J16_10515 [Melioribacteraceae bacterium]|nr:hypothetical protein [Melioribacteraceae bacterium]MCF8354471.1 hypothetical protein [Melioribacteraceae bacterium]MCF8394081.1 hypothetical protein [Melioribacteraceae bacterium]MCF8419866.1 hypothetical protein [Melioribacteraceae bacterium]